MTREPDVELVWYGRLLGTDEYRWIIYKAFGQAHYIAGKNPADWPPPNAETQP